jgi:hypothetical protein
LAIRAVKGHCRAVALSPDQEVDAWAASGAMALTATPGGQPVGPPRGLVPKLQAVAALLADRAAGLGGSLHLDPLVLLGERAALTQLPRGGVVSCGGGTHLLPSGPRWLAVTLARLADEEMVPAWLELDEPVDHLWDVVADALARRPVDDLVERAILLGLPIGLLPETPPAVPTVGGLPLLRVPVSASSPVAHRLAGLRVVDLSSLWAGPLCASLLAQAGAPVLKVESATRPDGARRGPVTFFNLLNARKQSEMVDLRCGEGVSRLHELVATADIVIEGSRPRALEQLGIRAREVLATGRPRVWASITGHGREGPGRERVAFGDDAAVAGGLVGWSDHRPLFCGDAIADPLTGIVAAAGILDAVAAGGRWLLDISMAQVAAHFSGLPISLAGWHGEAAPPRPRA